jgi:glycosyltransferase involved in cell wall biosynthesis
VTMRVSIVVPAFNEEKLLAQSLAAIRSASAAFAHRGWDAELIVCDNNSTDRTAAIAREAGAIVVFEPLNQISRARNAGAAHAHGDWLVFVDADSWPTRELFDDAAQAMESGDCLAGGVTLHYDTTRLDIRIPLAIWNAVSRLTKWAAGSFMFCEAAAFREVGGFSEALYAAEEVDFFCCRAPARQCSTAGARWDSSSCAWLRAADAHCAAATPASPGTTAAAR